MLPFPKTVHLLNRPQLIEPNHAPKYIARLLEADERALTRKANPLSVLARFAGMQKPKAMEDDEAGGGRVEPTKPKAYSPFWMGEPEDEGEYGWRLSRGVGVLNIDTPLVENGFGWCGIWWHGYDSIEAAIREMDADDRVKGVFIRYDTPGGVVAPGIYELTSFLQSRPAGSKPIWAFCDLAASAGYWLAAQADRIIAPNVGVVGSIGAVMTHVSLAGLYAREGVKVTAIQFGEHKTDGAEWQDLSPEAQAHMQAVIDDLGEDFLAAVEAGRGPKLTAEMAKATQARVYQAQMRDPALSGLALGFVDAVMPQREAFAQLVAEIGAASPIQVRPVAAGTKSPAAAGPAADAAKTNNPAARAASIQETDMKQRTALAAVLTAEALTDAQKLEEIQKILDEPSDDQPADPNAPPADGGTAAEDPPADDKQKDANAALVRAQAILALPEAKGREALAQELAFDPAYAGVSVDRAKRTLAAAAKVSTLAEQVHDPRLSNTGGKPVVGEEKDHAEAFNHAGVRMRRRG